jgi:hypothetical protein
METPTLAALVPFRLRDAAGQRTLSYRNVTNVTALQRVCILRVKPGRERPNWPIRSVPSPGNLSFAADSK